MSSTPYLKPNFTETAPSGPSQRPRRGQVLPKSLVPGPSSEWELLLAEPKPGGADAAGLRQAPLSVYARQCSRRTCVAGLNLVSGLGARKRSDASGSAGRKQLYVTVHVPVSYTHLTLPTKA